MEFLFVISILFLVFIILVVTSKFTGTHPIQTQTQQKTKITDFELSKDWGKVKLGDYLKYRKITQPTQKDTVQLIGRVPDEIINSSTNEEIEEAYHRLYFAVKTIPESYKFNKNDSTRLSVYPNQPIVSNLPELQNNSYIQYELRDYTKEYCGDEKELDYLKQKLLEKELDYLPMVISVLLKPYFLITSEKKQDLELYNKESAKMTLDEIAYNVPLDYALYVFKYFTGIEYKDLCLDNLNRITDAKKERSISQQVKDAVWRRAEGKCEQCGSRVNLEFDHIVPVSRGGSNTYKNVQLLCEKCNRSKSNKIG